MREGVRAIVKIIYSLTMSHLEDDIRRAAAAIKKASFIVLMSGAGMSHDSGIGTYRGKNATSFEDFWPPAKNQPNLTFYHLAKPRVMLEEPVLVWSYHKVRWDKYAFSDPHRGYDIMAGWARSAPKGCVCFTSNVDGMWKRMIDSNVVEYHGSIRRLQCAHHKTDCVTSGVWDAAPVMNTLHVDPKTGLLVGGELAKPFLPSCIHCGGLARLNVFGIGDSAFDESVRSVQMAKYKTLHYESPAGPEVVVIEVGAGRSIPTVRCQRAWWVKTKGATLIRINLEDAAIEDPHIKDAHVDNTVETQRHVSIEGLGALSALSALYAIYCGM